MTDRRQTERRVIAETSLSPAWNLDHVNRRRCATNRRQGIEPLTGTLAAQRDYWAAEAQTAWQQVAELRELLRRELGDKEARRVMAERRS